MGLVNASIPALLTEAAPDNQRGTILGVGSSLESISGVIMPPISTSVLGASGTPFAAGISAAFVVVARTRGFEAGRNQASPGALRL